MSAVLYQAYRSVDHTLLGWSVSPEFVGRAYGPQQSWSMLRDYYCGARMEHLVSAIRRLEALCPQWARYDRADTWRVIKRRYPDWKTPLVKIRTLVASALRRTAVPEDEIAVVALELQALINLLAQEEPPTLETLVDLRMRLTGAYLQFGSHGEGVRELDLAGQVENYGQPDFLPHYSIEEIMERVRDGGHTNAADPS